MHSTPLFSAAIWMLNGTQLRGWEGWWPGSAKVVVFGQPMRSHASSSCPTILRDLYGLIVGMEQTGISPRPVVGAIVVVSGLAVTFLLWLLYVHHASADFAGRWMFLPGLNALLNGLCAIALCAGFYFIKQHNWKAHRASMLLAFVFSSVFLVSYIVNHALHGDTIFPGHGAVRTLYLSILASHVILSIVALPLVLTTFFFSLTGRFAMHRRIARVTLPIWLYVSVTGVTVFVFLRAYAY
jgi:putative membrane protein